jgi:Holliday junction resolvase RusA-like endonuclease
MCIRGGRPHFFRDKKTSQFYSDARALATPFAPPAPLTGPIRLLVDFVIARPKSMRRPVGFALHTKRPDLDNLEKGLLDILSHSGFWLDDAQICDKHTRKVYAQAGGEPLIRIRICQIIEVQE